MTKKISTARKKNRTPKAPAKLEQLLKKAKAEHFELQLYVTGNTMRSAEAIANIRSLCEAYLRGRHTLKVIDIYQRPDEAERNQIIAAPTLIKERPLPPKRIIGSLSNPDKILIALNLHKKKAGAETGKELKWTVV